MFIVHYSVPRTSCQAAGFQNERLGDPVFLGAETPAPPIFDLALPIFKSWRRPCIWVYVLYCPSSFFPSQLCSSSYDGFIYTSLLWRLSFFNKNVGGELQYKDNKKEEGRFLPTETRSLFPDVEHSSPLPHNVFLVSERAADCTYNVNLRVRSSMSDKIYNIQLQQGL